MSSTIHRYAIVEGSTVTNVILWDGNLETWQPPEGAIAVLLDDDSPVSIDWSYIDGVFSPQ